MNPFRLPRAQTSPRHSFQRMTDLLRGAEATGRLAMNDAGVRGHVGGVRAELRKLDAYYGVGVE